MKKKRVTVQDELEWWQRRIVKLGAIVGAVVVILSAGVTAVSWFDGKYASAGDVQQLQVDVLHIRLDQLRRQRDELQVKKQPTDDDRKRLNQIQDDLKDLERRIRRAEEGKK